MNHAMVPRLIKQLMRAGVRQCFIGAGSRSTALVQEIDSQGIEIQPFFDERAVGFLALGYAKVSKKPSLVVTTSGSAVSNLYPAITEAANSYQNLIVLTADRPQRFQDTSANQTIRQTRMFNNVLVELQLPETLAGELEFWKNLNEAFLLQQKKGGVIHINCPLEDPVTHPYNPLEYVQGMPDDPTQFIKEQVDIPHFVLGQINSANSGVLCIGQTEPFVDQLELMAIIDHFNWPTIVDITQHLAKARPNVAQSADDAAVQLLDAKPDLVIYIGGAWVSKKMASFIACNSDRVIHFSQSYKPVVPLVGSNQLGQGLLRTSPQPSNVLSISDINKATQERLRKLPIKDEFHQVKNALSVNHDIDCFIANSLPIRYVDQLVLPNVKQLYCNRGASGIDGNIATIAGICLKETAVPLVAIVGDLTAFYDLNAFLLLKSAKRPFTIVILNNGGGCIFEKLPISKTYEKFDEHFKLKHNKQITPILKSMGLSCEKVNFIDCLNSIENSQKIVEVLL